MSSHFKKADRNGVALATAWPVVAALIGSLALANPVEAAVFGKDDRTAVPQRLDKVADKIGLLFNNQTRTVCSAFCIAENMIATAAHCMARGKPKGSVRYEDFTFARRYGQSRDFWKIEGAAAGAAEQSIMTGDFKLRVRPPIDAAHDWAIVRLQGKGCPGGGLPVRGLSSEELMQEAEAGKIYQISYHRDWAQWRPAYSKPCTISRDFDPVKWSQIAPDFLNPDNMILHTCDTGGASSGSPLLLDGPGGPAVVGINVGTYVQSRLVDVQRTGKSLPKQRAETIANTAVNAQVFANRIDALRTAVLLPNGKTMRELQERLRTLGHYSGATDSVYGSGLKSAIEAYEKAAQLPVTGLPTRSLLQRAGEDEARSGGGQVTPSSALPMQVPHSPQR